MTLYDFNTGVELVYEARSVEDAPKPDTTNYSPGGRTALHDAIATAVEGTETLVDGPPQVDRPDTVVVVVLTDGKANASETPQGTVRERVEYAQEELEWEFPFIGANQDAALTASGVGIDADRSLNTGHSGEGAQTACSSTPERVRRARREGSTGGFDAADRRRQREADDS